MAPTPETIAEAESIFSGNRSPVPSFRLGDQPEPLDLQPPDIDVKDGKPMYSKDEDRGEGVGGWITDVARRAANGSGTGSGKYKRVGQEDD